MFDTMPRFRLEVPLDGGRHTQPEIAEIAGMSERNVRRIAKEERAKSVGTKSTAGHIGRPSRTEPFREAEAKMLADESILMSLEILRPLRIVPENLAPRYPVSVGPTAHVVFETNRYAMPAEATGLPGTLFLCLDRVRLVAGPFAVELPRCFGRNQEVTGGELRASRLAAVSETRTTLPEYPEPTPNDGSTPDKEESNNE